MSIDLPVAKRFEKSTSNFYIIGTLCVIISLPTKKSKYVVWMTVIGQNFHFGGPKSAPSFPCNLAVIFEAKSSKAR